MNSLKEIEINNQTLNNRYVVSPMCQYSAKNGNPSEWHYFHLLKLAFSGAGMLMMESTAVSNEGRITLNDLTIKNNSNERSIKKLLTFLKKFSDIKIGIQISHAGRKGSSYVPWVKQNYPLNNKGWNTVAPSAIKRDKHWPTPKKLTLDKINKIKKDFLSAAKRSDNAGFDCLEIHMAHGYLLHQFFSKISNKRKDIYGGNLQNRTRLLLEISKSIRKIWPKNKILGARITGSDRLDNGNDIEDAIYLTKNLEKIGFDYVCISSGGILKKTKLKFKNGYNLDLAKIIKKNTKILVRTSGNINSFNLANNIIKKKFVDLVCIGRKFISEPNFLIKLLDKKSKKQLIPNQYKRCI